MVDNHKEGWVILTQPNCPWCVLAKDRLALFGVTPLIMDISQLGYLKVFIKHQGIKTVPQIYHSGVRVGGFDQLERYLGELGE